MAEQLALVLPGLDLSDSGPLALAAASDDGALGQRDADLNLALLLELRSLRDTDPAVREALAGQDRARLQAVLRCSLAGMDPSRVAAICALLGHEQAALVAATDRNQGFGHRMRTTLLANGLLARGVAVLWMNILVLVTVAAVVATVWGGFNLGGGPHDFAVPLLKVFALWCLSFLPGWLYVRFLGQRAGALWHEFVVHLHRLAWDEPCYLPRPPASSGFFAEWLRTGGPLYDQRKNLYRQKFDSYYGKAVVEGVQGTNFQVRVDTMFPVFLSTAVLAVGWATVLWDPSFLTSPETLWDILRFAFLGAYVFIVQSLIRRFFQSDLRPSAYASTVLRVIVVVLVTTALYQVLQGSGEVKAAIAFVVGIFPIIALQALQRVVASALRIVVPQLSPDYPLNQLDGLNIWYEARLLEEGIEDMENLKTANLVDVILHTRVPVGRLVDWVDQAALYIHLDRVERGWGETRLVRHARREELVELKKVRCGATGTAEVPDGTDGGTDGGAADNLAVDHARLGGSLNYALRAGTRTRVALRQLGIRTATDLLKAFPPEQVDRADSDAPSRPAFQRLLPAGLDHGQLRTLVRVLDEDVDLAAVWNWQARGVLARETERRPRSTRLPVQRGLASGRETRPAPTAP